jgi:hypothetical protein
MLQIQLDSLEQWSASRGPRPFPKWPLEPLVP